MSQLKTPILFVIFNRPDTTEQVFETIRKVLPKFLYVAADGPRAGKEGEKEKCEAARAVIQHVDWPCKVQTLFRDENMGCGKAVSSALAWFFGQVDEGIILEDDCLPHSEFFPYCEEMLNRYRTIEKVKFIGGANFQDGKKMGNASYYFSMYSHIWGWASWRRVWKHYNFTLDGISWNALQPYLQQQGFSRGAIEHWRNIFEMMKSNRIDTWDNQLIFSIWKNTGLSIIPNVNLVSNIGFGDGATHTKEMDSSFSNIQTASIFPIRHADEVRACRRADKRYFDHKVKIKLITKIRMKISNFINRN